MSSEPKPVTYGEAGASDLAEEQRRLLDDRFAELYDKIRRLAARVRWSGTNPTLNPTALAHEAYLKLRQKPGELAAKPYEEVIPIFANAMHQILIDAARRKSAQKRLGASLPECSDLPVEDALTIADAVAAMGTENAQRARVVQCRFLLGMTVDETAAAMGVSKRTVERQWQEAKEALAKRIDPKAIV